MKVTYLLGAGASYKAVPIIGELNNAFLEINNLCNSSTDVNRRSDLIRAKGLFDSHMKTGAKAAKLFGTVDTYSKKLALTNVNDLIQFKAALSLFFTIWQDIDKVSVSPRKREGRFEDVDNRYTGLLANYLHKKHEKIQLDDDVNFLTWNYDTQLERALSLFIDKGLEDILQEFTVYPFVTDKKPKILHLNGIAGLYKDVEDENKIKTLFKKQDYKNINQLFESILNFIDKSENKQISNNEHFTYAWENDPTSLNALNYADEILKETNVLVIIGYSFPTFNDTVDKRLFNVLNNSKNFTMVYYQDPNASIELLNARFGIKEEKIKIVNEVEQFILPLESHIISKNEPIKSRAFYINPQKSNRNTY